MSQPASNQNDPSKMTKLLSGKLDESIRSRLPRRNGPKESPPSPAPAVSSISSDNGSKSSGYKFLPAFWTITGAISLVVNIILIVILLITLQLLGTIRITANDQISGLLGGLYTNFVKMDEAHITTNIHVEKEIPVQFSLNVNGPTNVVLSQDVTINGALVTVETGGLNILNARATIILPKDTLLPVNIQNLVVPVDQKVLASLDVPVDIPLSQTQLHEPFAGLQQVVKPYYCFVEPNALMNGLQVCSPLSTQP